MDIKNWLSGNSDALIGLGAGLLGGRTASDQIAGGLNGFATARKDAKTKNATLGWLQQNNPDLAQLMASGAIDPQGAVKLAWEQRLQSQKPKSYDFQTLPNGDYGTFDPTTGAFNKIGSAPKAGADGQPQTGFTPVWAKDPQTGKYVPFLPANNGQMVRVPAPDGVDFLGPQGTEYDKANGKALGGAAGASQANLPGYVSDAQRGIDTIEELKMHPGRQTATGASSTFDPRNYLAGTDATDFNTKLDQLKGRSFLQAYQALRGTGSISEVEGAKAEKAIANLNTAQSEGQFLQSLNDLEDVIKAGVAREQQKAQGNFGGQAAPMAPGKTSTGVSFSIEGP